MPTHLLYTPTGPVQPLGDGATLLVPTGDSPVHFFWDFRETTYDDELGFFRVDGPDGRITEREAGDPWGAPLLADDGTPQYARPGDADYAEWALAAANSLTAFESGEVANYGHADKIVTVPWDGYIAFYVIQNSTAEAWRQAAIEDRPHVWFSLGKANADGDEHFQKAARKDVFYRKDLLQFKVEDTSLSLPNADGQAGNADYNDVVFSVNIVPFANSDAYSVFNAGADFSGKPVGFKVDTPDDTKNRGLGLLSTDYDVEGRKLTVTDISLDDGTTWIPVTDPATRRTKLTVSDPALHGTITVYSNGGLQFLPGSDDPYWYPGPDDPEPVPVEFAYRISDGIDSQWAYVDITHGYYHVGEQSDSLHKGQDMYFLAGGGDETPFLEGLTKFFVDGSAGQDIVMISQGFEEKDTVDWVFYELAQEECRSVTSLDILTREQANDPRIARIVDGADALWFWGGSQELYQSVWAGTRVFSAIARAAASHVAIGGSSAGLAILGQAAFVNLPWDTLHSPFATENPKDARVRLMYQADGSLPFAGMSTGKAAPLYGVVTETHFAARDRMGRLATFAARSKLRGLGVDEETALLIEKTAGGWNWTVYADPDEGEEYSQAYLVMPETNSTTARYEDHGRLTFGPLNVYRLSGSLEGTTYGTPAEIVGGGPSYRIWVSKGTIYTTENDGSLY